MEGIANNTQTTSYSMNLQTSQPECVISSFFRQSDFILKATDRLAYAYRHAICSRHFIKVPNGVSYKYLCYYYQHNVFLECLERVEKIVQQKVVYYKVDIRDKEGLSKVFSQVKHPPFQDAVNINTTIPSYYYNREL